MTRTDLNKSFHKHKTSSEIGRALEVLHEARKARFETEKTNGREIERWYAIIENNVR